MSQVRRIALLMGQDLGYCRGVLRGIHTYAVHEAHGSSAMLARSRVLPAARVAAARHHRPSVRRPVRPPRDRPAQTAGQYDQHAGGRLTSPLVEVDQRGRSGGWRPNIFSSGGSRASATSAAAGPVSRSSGSRGFANRWPRPAKRFRPATPSICRARRCGQLEKVDRQVREWLFALPKPVAILASNDVPARHLAEMCRPWGFACPNSRAAGRRQRRDGMPAVPSAAVERRQSGRADRLRGGPTAPPPDVGPAAAANGRSSSADAYRHPPIDRHRGRGRPGRFGGGGLHPRPRGRGHRRDRRGRAMNLSRRRLERRFRTRLGRTILEEIQRVPSSGQDTSGREQISISGDCPAVRFLDTAAAGGGFSAGHRRVAAGLSASYEGACPNGVLSLLDAARCRNTTHVLRKMCLHGAVLRSNLATSVPPSSPPFRGESHVLPFGRSPCRRCGVPGLRRPRRGTLTYADLVQTDDGPGALGRAAGGGRERAPSGRAAIAPASTTRRPASTSAGTPTATTTACIRKEGDQIGDGRNEWAGLHLANLVGRARRRDTSRSTSTARRRRRRFAVRELLQRRDGPVQLPDALLQSAKTMGCRGPEPLHADPLSEVVQDRGRPGLSATILHDSIRDRHVEVLACGAHRLEVVGEIG